MFMKLTTKSEFNTACPHSSSLVSTNQDLNIVYVQNGHNQAVGLVSTFKHATVKSTEN